MRQIDRVGTHREDGEDASVQSEPTHRFSHIEINAKAFLAHGQPSDNSLTHARGVAYLIAQVGVRLARAGTR